MFRISQMNTTETTTILVMIDEKPFEGFLTHEGNEMKIRSNENHDHKYHISMITLNRMNPDNESDDVSIVLDTGYARVYDLKFSQPVAEPPAATIDLPKSLQFVNNLRQVKARGHIWFEDDMGYEHKFDLGLAVGTLTYEVA